MAEGIRSVTSIYVDRSKHQWVVRDREGNLWIVPPTNDPWDDREPFELTEETELELVPGHYRSALGLPF